MKEELNYEKIKKYKIYEPDNDLLSTCYGGNKTIAIKIFKYSKYKPKYALIVFRSISKEKNWECWKFWGVYKILCKLVFKLFHEIFYILCFPAF